MQINRLAPVAFALSALATAVHPREIDFLSMWISDGEIRAVEQLERHAFELGFEFRRFTAHGNFNGTRATFTRMMLDDNPPDVVQWIIGDELNLLIESGLVQDINIRKEYQTSHFVEEIEHAISHGVGRVNSIPLAIHVQNHILYNVDVLNAAGVAIPESLDELIDALPTLAERGYVPISMSGQNWQVRTLLIALLSVELSRDQLEDITKGVLDDDALFPIFRKTFERLKKLTSYADEDFLDRSWQASTAQVLEGTAAFQILGDYVSSEIVQKGNYACQLVPGARFLIWGADGLAFTDFADGLSEDQVSLIAERFVSPQVQQEYIAQKGGIPVVQEFDVAKLSACSQENLANWEKFEGNRFWLDGNTWRTTLETIGSVGVATIMREGDWSPDVAAINLLEALRQSH